MERARAWSARCGVVMLVVAAGCALAADPPADYPRIDLAAAFEVVPGWPRHPADWTPAAVPSIAIDHDGVIWAYTRSNPVVQVFTPDGELVASWREEDPRTVPHAIRFDGEGRVWLVDVGLHVARRFDRAGRPDLVLGTLGKPGDDERHLDKPTDIAFGTDGSIYVSDGYGNNRIVRYDAQGRFERAWGGLGVDPGRFSLPHSVAVDSRDRVYVADRNNVRVQVFDRDGTLLDVWSNLLVPWTLCRLPDDSIWVCGSAPMTWSVHPDYPTAPLGCPPDDQLVMRFDPHGRLHELRTLPKGADGRERPGDVNWIHGLAVADDGAMYVGDIIGRRLQKFVRRRSAAAQPDPDRRAPGQAYPLGGAPATTAETGTAETGTAETGTAAPAAVAGPLADTIALGRELVATTATHPLSREYVGNSLSCTSCHLDNGTHPTAASLLDVATAYPAWAPREGRVITLEDRILNCFMRSCNGIRPPQGSEVSVAIVAYITSLSAGRPLRMNAESPHGPRRVPRLAIDAAAARSDVGGTLYADRCAGCHAADGQGTADGPPVWGPRSFNTGAGLAQAATLAAWLKLAMPLGDADLTEQEALDIAAYVTGRPRPEFRLEEHLPPAGKLGEYNGAR